MNDDFTRTPQSWAPPGLFLAMDTAGEEGSVAIALRPGPKDAGSEPMKSMRPFWFPHSRTFWKRLERAQRTWLVWWWEQVLDPSPGSGWEPPRPRAWPGP
jgi:hypothetical protein